MLEAVRHVDQSRVKTKQINLICKDQVVAEAQRLLLGVDDIPYTMRCLNNNDSKIRAVRDRFQKLVQVYTLD